MIELSETITHTSSYLGCKLSRIFHMVGNGKRYESILLLPTNHRTMEAYQIQTVLGWHHFVRGRMAIEWGNAINDHLA
jgi:hypothetical protein